MSHYPSWLRKHSRKSHPHLPFDFISMETETAAAAAGKSPNRDAEVGNSPTAAAADEEIPCEEEVPRESSALEPEELFAEEDSPVTTGNSRHALVTGLDQGGYIFYA